MDHKVKDIYKYMTKQNMNCSIPAVAIFSYPKIAPFQQIFDKDLVLPDIKIYTVRQIVYKLLGELTSATRN